MLPTDTCHITKDGHGHCGLCGEHHATKDCPHRPSSPEPAGNGQPKR